MMADTRLLIAGERTVEERHGGRDGRQPASP
jgi:hypothetical protein